MTATVIGDVDDGRTDDPTLHAVCRVQTRDGVVPVTFHGSDHRTVSLFEVDVVCARGRVRMSDRGATVTLGQVVADPTFAGYTTLQDATPLAGGLERAVGALWADLVAVRRGERDAPRCTLDDGLAALRVVAATREAAKTGESQPIRDGEVRR